MKIQIQRNLVAAVSLMMVSVSFADYDVLVNIEGGNRIERYSVSSDGKTWTKGDNFLGTSTPLTFAAPGDGYVYAAVGSSIDRYDLTGTKVGTWKSGLSSKVRIYLSHDHIWFYVGNNGNKSQYVTRFRVSDPNIGGVLGLNDASHGGLDGANNRDITFGRDGVLYLGCRGSNITDTTNPNYGTNDMTRGVFAYDVTASGYPLLCRYPATGGSNGMAVLVDDDQDRIISNDSKLRYFNFNNPVQTAEKTSPGGLAFYTFTLGDMKFFGNYSSGGTGLVHLYDLKTDTFTSTQISEKAAAISDITDANNGSQLPNITGVWYMNEASGTNVVNGANPGVMDIFTHGEVRTGFRGASRYGLLVRDGGLATVKDSKTLVPATGNFTVGLWLKVGTGVARFSNGVNSLGVDADGKPYFTAGGVTVKGNATVASAWHSLMAVRNGGQIELLVDNASVGSATLDAATALDQPANWTLSAAGAYFDELRVYPALLTAADRTLLYGLVSPEVSEEDPFDDRTAKKIGAVVMHKDPVLGSVSAPSVAVVGAKVFVAVDGNVYASANGGVDWAKCGAVGLKSVSLFVDNGALYAVGQNGDGQLSLGRASNEGKSWVVSTIGNGLNVSTLEPTQPVLSGGRVWMGAVSADSRSVYTISFAFAGGTASDPKCATATSTCINQLTGVSTAVDTNGSICVFGSMRRGNVDFGEGFAVIKTLADSSSAYARVMNFPAATKPVSIAYDSQTKRYWMVTAAWHMKDRQSGLSPFDRATALALYSSSDLADWYYHGDVTDVSVPAHFRSPSIACVGNDLVIAVRTSIDDGVLGVDLAGRLLDNVLSVRVSNFRNHWTPRIAARAYHAKELLICEETDKIVSRYYREDLTGDWIPSGILCNGNDTFKDETGVNRQPGTMVTVRSFGGSVFVSSTSAKGVFEFSKTGKFVRFYPLSENPDGMCISLDGAKIYATKWWGSIVYAVDRASNTCTALKDFGADVSVSRGVADIGDGEIAVSSRSTGKVLVYDTTKGTVETLLDFGTSGWGPQDMFYEVATRRLYIAGGSCGVGYYDFDKKSYVKLNANTYHAITHWDAGTLVATSYGTKDSLTDPGRALSLAETAESAPTQALGVICAGNQLNRCCTIENDKPQIGMLFVVR